MNFPETMAAAINQAIGYSLGWEYGLDSAELPRGVDVNDARFAVQFHDLYQSCYVSDWSENRGLLKPELTADQQLMQDFWHDDKFDRAKTAELTEKIRAAVWSRLGVHV